jgi:hypothetical protein
MWTLAKIDQFSLTPLAADDPNSFDDEEEEEEDSDAKSTDEDFTVSDLKVENQILREEVSRLYDQLIRSPESSAHRLVQANIGCNTSLSGLELDILQENFHRLDQQHVQLKLVNQELHKRILQYEERHRQLEDQITKKNLNLLKMLSVKRRLDDLLRTQHKQYDQHLESQRLIYQLQHEKKNILEKLDAIVKEIDRKTQEIKTLRLELQGIAKEYNNSLEEVTLLYIFLLIS